MENSSGEALTSTLVKPLAPELIILVFIHGFKGDDTTFAQFPERLQHILGETFRNVIVETMVFPAYETKGDLGIAVENLSDWLATQTVEKEVAHGAGRGAGKAQIVLCGHSMGGLLAADALIAIAQSRVTASTPLWPNIVACVAFDTPYFGVHPHVFKNSATSAIQTASTVFSGLSALSAYRKSASRTSTPPIGPPPPAILPAPSTKANSNSSWTTWAPAVGGALLAGAAAGTAYWRRDDVGMGWKWFAEHTKYVSNLWDEESMKGRVTKLLSIGQECGVLFRTVYTYLPPNTVQPVQLTSRTFVVLPPASNAAHKYFIRAPNTIAPDEIRAHIGMFEASTNDGFYDMGLLTADLIRQAVLFRQGLGPAQTMESYKDGLE